MRMILPNGDDLTAARPRVAGVDVDALAVAVLRGGEDEA